MQTQCPVAQIRFTQYDIHLYGMVKEMDQKRVTVRLQTLPATPLFFQANLPAELAVVAKHKLYHAITQVQSENNGDLTLAFTNGIKAVQRRRDERISCNIEVSFRSAQRHGCYRMWKSAVTTNLSPNGMGLVIPPDLEVPKRIEVRFTLPEPLSEAKRDLSGGSVMVNTAAQMPVENRVDRSRPSSWDIPIELIARVAHSRVRADGYISVGLAFTMISSEDQIRLLQYLTGPQITLP